MKNIIKHNEVPCVEAKVHMLPTEDLTMIRRNTYKFTEQHGNPLEYGRVRNAVERGYEYQHLYITTDEEIKEGVNQYYIDKFTDKLSQSGGAQYGEKQDVVIATTDPKFRNSQYTKEELGGATPKIYGLPQIPQSFIEEYCKAGGIDKVLVEYTTREFRVIKGGTDLCMETETTIKTDPNNCIIIHPVEEKMYSREEVEAMLILAYNLTECSLNEWIKENL